MIGDDLTLHPSLKTETTQSSLLSIGHTGGVARGMQCA